MSVLQRAIIMLKNNMLQTIIWLVVFLITIGFIMVSFFTNDLYQSILADIFVDGDVPVYVMPELSKGSSDQFVGNNSEYSVLSAEDKEKISHSSYVTKVDKSFSSQLDMGSLKVENSTYSNSNSLNANYISKPEDVEAEEGFSLVKTTTEAFTSLNQIILSETLLSQNDLEVGDEITLDLNQPGVGDDGYAELENIKFKIIGSYKFEPTQKMIDAERENAAKLNYEPDLDFAYMQTTVFLSQKLALTINDLEKQPDEKEQVINSNYTYYLSDISNLNDFKVEAEQISGIGLDVDVNTMDLKDGKVTVDMLSIIIMTINSLLKVAIFIVSFILILISALFIKGRQKEIGILLALGAKRKTIYVQLIVELLIPMFISLIIMYVLGTMVCIGLVSNIGLGNAILLSPLIKSLALGVILVSIATFIPAILIIRLEPKKILM